jgi:biopolymer transport protein ExbB
MIRTVLQEWTSLLEQGGFVMWPLTALAVLLWFGLGYRLMLLRRGSNLDVRHLIGLYWDRPDLKPRGFVDAAASLAAMVRKKQPGDIKRYLDEELFSLSEGMRRFRTIVRTIVVIAPLLGLLGTVIGMIEMFESLGSRTFYSQSGGVANGISQALLTTQLGLLIAVPGMIVGRLLDRREGKMRSEIEQIKEYVNSSAGEVYKEPA